MTLYNVVSCIPGKKIVTVEDYVTHEIFIDCDTAWNVIHNHDQIFHKFGLKNFTVYKLDVGEVFGDIIISVMNDKKEKEQ